MELRSTLVMAFHLLFILVFTLYTPFDCFKFSMCNIFIVAGIMMKFAAECLFGANEDATFYRSVAAGYPYADLQLTPTEDDEWLLVDDINTSDESKSFMSCNINIM